MDWTNYYSNQAQGNDNVYKGVPLQAGFGLGSMFKRFFRAIIPYAKKYAAPVAKTIGSEVVGSVTNMAKDLLAGKDFKESGKQRLNETVDNFNQKATSVLEKLEQGQPKEGQGLKRKKKRKNQKGGYSKKLKKNIYIHDIFNS